MFKVLVKLKLYSFACINMSKIVITYIKTDGVDKKPEGNN